ncbi:MAG: haloacid dehalogenase-like hydrolase [Cyanobacteria bacterium J06614_10]
MKKKVTRSLSNRIAIVFDFDETLTPEDSFATILRDLDLNPDAFTSERIQPLIDQGWEEYLARAYCLVQESNQRDDKITKDRLAAIGQKISLYEGTTELFSKLQQSIKAIAENVELEFYLISGGFVDISRNTPVAKDFKCMWGCEFQYGPSGEIEFMKKQMTHVEKTRYLYYLSKGTDSQNEKDLVYNYDSVPPEQLHIPLEQVIYIGDGASDIPCFAVMKQYGGIAIGIYTSEATPESWEHLDRVNRDQRLSNLVPASYADDSELVRSLILSVEYLAKRIALRQMSKGE